MSDSWRSPNRVLLVALGGLTVFFLVVPTLIIVPMGFSSSQILTFPPPGWSLQWYEKMLTDRQWTTGFLNSFQVATVTAIVAAPAYQVRGYSAIIRATGVRRLSRTAR